MVVQDVRSSVTKATRNELTGDTRIEVFPIGDGSGIVETELHTYFVRSDGGVTVTRKSQ